MEDRTSLLDTQSDIRRLYVFYGHFEVLISQLYLIQFYHQNTRKARGDDQKLTLFLSLTLKFKILGPGNAAQSPGYNLLQNVETGSDYSRLRSRPMIGGRRMKELQPDVAYRS